MTKRRTKLVSLLFLLLLIFAAAAEADTMTLSQDTPSGTLRMTLKVHTHEFSFSVDGATITATCANSDTLCKLTDNKATLTITAPTAGGGAAVLSGDLKLFGVSSSNIKYAVKSGSSWGTETSTVPTETGFFRASITVSKDSTASASASVTLRCQRNICSVRNNERHSNSSRCCDRKRRSASDDNSGHRLLAGDHHGDNISRRICNLSNYQC